MKSLFLIQLIISYFVVTSYSQHKDFQETIDHAQIIKSLDEKSMIEGRRLYQEVCAACHGKDGSSSLSSARSFNKDDFKFGTDPYSMWKNIRNGVGQMGAQRWLSPEETYAVVQYIREEIISDNNPDAYFQVSEDYLVSLPKSTMSPEELDKLIRREALSGSQEYGQRFFENHFGDYGNAMYLQLKDHGSSNFTINLAEDVNISYNVLRMSISAVWQGSINFQGTKYMLYRGDFQPKIDGEEHTPLTGMHWSFQDRHQQLEALVSDRTPFPSKWLEYHGHYQNGDKVILSYSIIGRDILEMPAARVLNNLPVIQHTFNIGPGESWRKLMIGELRSSVINTIKEGVFDLDEMRSQTGQPGGQWINPENSLIVTGIGDKDLQQFLAAGIQGDTRGMKWLIEPNHRLALYIPPSSENQIIRIHRYTGENIQDLDSFAKFVSEENKRPVQDPEEFTNGGERRWNTIISLQGLLNVGIPHYNPVYFKREDRLEPEQLVKIPENYPYEVDEIPLPFNNPWDSWIRPSGLDFYPDGRLVICTYAGDVWLANGIDDTLQNVEWQRIATGLYDPFGLKIVDNEIFVTCRDRIVRLKDLNGDNEVDFYENFFADTDVSHIPVQAFNYSLQTDSKGNFLYSKGGQYTTDDEPGHILRISSDGKKQESIAVGFRAPNGVTVGPNDEIFASDNQGNWIPANKINLIEKGNFYGFIPTLEPHSESEYRMRSPLATSNYPDEILPDTFDQPIIWLPQEFDTSPGEGTWTPADWGPLGDRLIHTSYGKGWVYQILLDEVDGITQAAVSALPFQFSAGTQRARFNPNDDQLYIAGITGWDDSFASKYGSIDRIRYVGGEGFFIDGVKVHSDGIEINFNQKLNQEKCLSLSNYQIEQWNYRWAESYGSADWSVKNPDKEGRDTVVVEGIVLTNRNRSLMLMLSEENFQPVDQMRLLINVESEDGQTYKDAIYLTIHKIPGYKSTIFNGGMWVLGLGVTLISLLVSLFFWKKDCLLPK